MRKITLLIIAGLAAGCAGTPSNYSSYESSSRNTIVKNILLDIEQEKNINGSAAGLERDQKDYGLSAGNIAQTNFPDLPKQGFSQREKYLEKSIKTESIWHTAGWEQFGDWYVKALHDDMDTVTQVRMFTTFQYTSSGSGSNFFLQKDFNLGFMLFGGEVVTLSPSAGFLGQGYWPYCDYDLSSVSVDEAKAVRLTTVDSPGSCNLVDKNGTAVMQLKKGKEARVRMGSMNGVISLDGFSKAWSRALNIGK